MSHVDALSRVSSISPNKSIDEELLYRQLTDPQIQAISNLLETSDHEEYTLIEGLVYKKGPDKPKFYVPEPMVSNLLRLYHDDQAHCSIEKTFQGLASNYWFPSMRNRIKEYIGNCLVCMLANTSTNVREGELQTTFTPNIPFQVVHTDHYGPLIETSDGRKHILILVDAYSRFTWLFAVKSAGTREVIENFRYVFNTFGNPELLVSDRGTAFTSGEFATFLQERNIKHQLVAVAAPWSNGLVERINRFLKSSLKKVIEEQTSWSSKLNIIQYVINNTYHSSLKATPSKVLLGYECRGHADSPLIKFLNSHAKVDLNIESIRELSKQVAVEATNKLKDYNKTYYDKHHKLPTKYSPGDFVLIRDTGSKPREDKKLKPAYKGPPPIRFVKFLTKIDTSCKTFQVFHIRRNPTIPFFHLTD